MAGFLICRKALETIARSAGMAHTTMHIPVSPHLMIVITKSQMDGLDMFELRQLYSKTGSKLVAREIRRRLSALGDFMRDAQGHLIMD